MDEKDTPPDPATPQDSGEATQAKPAPKRELDALSVDLIRSMIDADRERREAEQTAVAEAAPVAEPEAAAATVSPEPDRWASLRASFQEFQEEMDAPEAGPEDSEAEGSVDQEDMTEADVQAGAPDTPEPDGGRPLSPIERIRARTAQARPAQPLTQTPDGLAYVPADDSAFGPTGTLDDPEPPAPTHQPLSADGAGTAALAAEPEAVEEDDRPARRDFVERKEAPPPRDWGSLADHEMSQTGKLAWRVAIYGTLVAIPTAFFLLSPFGPKDTVAHYSAGLGCQFAQIWGLEKMREGEVGYHAALDEDANGVVCEANDRQLTVADGPFIRP